MLVSLTNRDLSNATAQALHRQTEGNPLFVQEIARYQIGDYLVAQIGESCQFASDSPFAARLPEGVRDAIGNRMSRLSPECSQALAVAAVIGREFRVKTLRHVAELDEAVLPTALEDTQRARVIEDTSSSAEVTFRFGHALLRQTLYEELFTPRRLLIHQRIARAVFLHHQPRLQLSLRSLTSSQLRF